MALRIKKGDKVVVTTGKDKGKQGEVTKVLLVEERVVVAGVNLVKKHNKPSRVSAGGIEEFEKPIHVSNVMLVDPKSGKPTRFGVKVLGDGKKVRVAKKSGEVIDA